MPSSRPPKRGLRAALTTVRSTPDDTLTMSLPAALYDWLQAYARYEERSVQEIVVHAVAAYRAEAELMEEVMARELGRLKSSRSDAGARAPVPLLPGGARRILERRKRPATKRAERRPAGGRKAGRKR